MHRLDGYLGGSRVVQLVLGYEKTARGVIDRLGAMRWEYDRHSVIGNMLFASGKFEDLEIRFFERILAQASRPIVLDVGANIGVHTVRWAQALPAARIYAFEPSMSTVELLRANIARNHLAGRVEVIPSAVSNYCGPGKFFHCEDDAYSSLRDTERKAVTESYTVDVTTIDSFVGSRDLARIDLIKIDVEGFEGQVLEGGSQTLRRLRPHLFVEIFGGKNSNPDPEGTVEFVRQLGYAPFVLKNGTAEAFVKHSDKFFNYYFRPLV
jgi:FkbM family methyltransferase